jgi:putative addiction module CopG family antidote
MPTRNVNLTEQLDRFILTKVESGRYENASEVVRAALRTLEREEQQYGAKLAGLPAALPKAMYSRASVKRFIFPCHVRLWASFVYPVLPRLIC